jgi:hypothetical protein
MYPRRCQCLIAAVALSFLLIKPQQVRYKAALTKYKAAEPLGNEQARAAALRDRDRAYEDLAAAQQSLDVQMEKRMPHLNFSNRETGMIALWKEQIVNMGPYLESFAVGDKKVEVFAPSFTLPAPPANPNDPVFGQDVIVFELGNIQVEGKFKSIMDNIRRWNNCGRLVKVGPVTLQGESPRLLATYSLTCYVYPAATAKDVPAIAIAGQSTAQPNM